MIRAAQMEDVPTLAVILNDWIDETPWMPRLHGMDDHRQFIGHLIDMSEVFVVGEGRATGFLSHEKGLVKALYLQQDSRGLGYGKTLLDHVRTERSCLTLWMFQANLRAIAFYRREGFVEVERTDGQRNDEKLPDLRMVWERTDR